LYDRTFGKGRAVTMLKEKRTVLLVRKGGGECSSRRIKKSGRTKNLLLDQDKKRTKTQRLIIKHANECRSHVAALLRGEPKELHLGWSRKGS